MQQSRMDLSLILAQIARSQVITSGNLNEALQDITQTASAALTVERVNIWVFDETRSSILCIEGFDSKTQQHNSGEVLLAIYLPTYFEALKNLKTIAYFEAQNDARTKELKEPYLVPNRITTMLYAPIYLSGQVIGMVCHEHTITQREWTKEEMSFAGSIADFISIALEADRRSRGEQRDLELQAALLESSRLESLGLLAGGIAHDFNNLVGVILVHTDLALLIAKEKDSLRNHIVEIQNAAEHAAQICQQLLNYSGKRQVVLENVNLSFLVEEILRVLKVIISDKAELNFDLATDLPTIQADVMQLRQLIMNLVTNASDALEENPGTITIKTGVDYFTQKDLTGVIQDSRLPEGQYVYCEVADTGSGMDQETQRKMFKPFFTTKISGKGLGIAGVLDHVKAHQGTIQVKSELNQGTTIRVLLPVAQAHINADSTNS
jgi:signal transduction histidine kinase